MPRLILIKYSGNLGHVKIFVDSIGTSASCPSLVTIGTIRHIPLSRQYLFTSLRFSEVLERFRFLRNIPSLQHQTPNRHGERCNSIHWLNV